MAYLGIIERYREYLPVSEQTPIISLKEGNTPLIRASFLNNLVGGGAEVWLKYEGLNPSGSFKDRGMTLAVSRAMEDGSEAVICASTGNTSASAAAYAAHAKIKCIVLIPRGAIASGKLAQALIHGAKVIPVDANFDTALKLVREICDKFPITLVNSLNPNRIAGQKTGAFEICDDLNDAPDYHAIPVGNAGNITAYWKGYKEYHQKGKISKLPHMLGFQAAGAAPIVKGKVVKNPETIATAIRIGNPASWKQAVEARDESNGLIDTVSDEEIIEAYKLLANQEGIFVEPASAASVAGVIKLAKQGYFKRTTNDPEKIGDFPGLSPRNFKEIPEGERRTTKIVCILTGHGLKDPDRAIKSIQEPRVVAANLKAVLKEISERPRNL